MIRINNTSIKIIKSPIKVISVKFNNTQERIEIARKLTAMKGK